MSDKGYPQLHTPTRDVISENIYRHLIPTPLAHCNGWLCSTGQLSASRLSATLILPRPPPGRPHEDNPDDVDCGAGYRVQRPPCTIVISEPPVRGGPVGQGTCDGLHKEGSGGGRDIA